MWTRIGFVSLLLLGLVFSVARAFAATTIPVTIVAPLAYSFSGGPGDAPLTLVRGQTYIFQLSASDALNHPFVISTTTGVEPPTLFVNPGLTGNGTATVTFTVPNTATPPLFYQCAVHSFMTNTITLTAAPVAAPALGTFMALGFGALLCAAGVLALRRRTA